MTLYFRFIAMLFYLLRSKSNVPLTEKTVLKSRVWPSDLDINLHMTNARYSSLMDLAQLNYLARTGVLKLMRKNKWFPLISGSQILFRKDLKLFEAFEIHTQIRSWDHKWWYFVHSFIKNGKLVAVARSRGTLKGKAGIINPADLFQMLNQGENPPFLSETVTLWNENLWDPSVG